MKPYKKTILVLSIAFLTISLQSCYKIKEKVITKGTITCIDTNNVGISGVKYRIYEKKYRFSNPTTFLTGETDGTGEAYFEFNQPSSISNNKWSYYLEVLPNSFPENYNASLIKGNVHQTLDFIIDGQVYNPNDVTIKFTPK